MAWLYVVGPWDSGRVQFACDHLSLARANADMAPNWGLVVVVLESTECSTDALVAIRALALQACRQKGLSGVAWVMAADLEGRGVMPSVLDSVYEGVCPMQLFESEAEAESWLRKKLSQRTGSGRRQ